MSGHSVMGSPGGGEASSGVADFDLRQYVGVLRQRWLLIAILAAVGLGVGYFRYSVTPQLYRAVAVVQINRQILSAAMSGIEPFLENWWNTEYYPTQYRLLRSRGLAEKVVVALELDRDADFRGTSVGATSEDASVALANMANRLLSGLTIDPIERTQLVEIEYRSSDPVFAALVANSFAEGYINWGIEDRRLVADSATRFLSQQIDQLKGQIEETDRTLKERQAADSRLVVDSGDSASASRLDSLALSHATAVRNRIEKEALYRALLATQAETVAERESSGMISKLRREQEERERSYASQLKTYKPEYPAMVELKEEIDRAAEDLDQIIAEAVTEARESSSAELQAARRQEEQLLGEIGRLRGEAVESSSRTVELQNLRRELTNRQSQLEGVLERQSRTEVQARLQAQGESNVRVVDSAIVPMSPFQPNLSYDLSTGSAVGFLAGVLFAFLFNFLDRSIKTSEDMERCTGLPTLGVVADIAAGGKRNYGYYGYYGSYGSRRAKRGLPGDDGDERPQIELVTSRNPRLAISESYRSMRAALLLSSAEQLRTIVVTSASSGEGKSATAVNLASVLAQLGRRVLLVDADLRKPRQHQILEISNRVGLVTCLTGQAGPDEIVMSTEIDNLSVVLSGPSSPNPSELLGSERMKEVLAYYRSSFDMVLLDTPPVLAVSDAILVGSECQGVVYCVSAGSTLREDAKAGLERLLLADVRVLGAVLNRYQHKHGSYRGQRYSQYYSYARPDEAESAA